MTFVSNENGATTTMTGIGWDCTWKFIERVAQAGLGLPPHRRILFDAVALDH